MSIEQRLDSGPLRVRSLWDEGKTAELPALILKRRRERFLVRSVSLTACTLAGFLLLWSSGTTQELAPGPSPSERNAGAVAASEATASEVERPSHTLGDGTLIFAESAQQVSVEQTSRGGDSGSIVASLHGGSARFSVKKGPRRTFEVDAGSVRIEVIGTEFTVTREEDRARVLVEEGVVRVTWDSGSRLLRAGEGGWFPPESAAIESAAIESASPRVAPAKAAPSPTDGWRALAREAEYEASYEALATQKGQLGTAADLMLAADVARLSRHPGEAVELLSRVAREFPTDPRAPLAEFTRGRVLVENLGNPAAAALAFERARTLAPSGSLAEDALARQIEATRAVGQASRAQALARQYLRSYPQGRHRARCEKLIDE